MSMEQQAQSQWIKDFIDGTQQLFAGQNLGAVQPIDFFSFYTTWHANWVQSIDELLTELGAYQKEYSQLQDLLPGPSSIRAVLIKFVLSYSASAETGAGSYKRVTNFLARMLHAAVTTDPFAKISQRIHSQAQIEQTLSQLELHSPSGEMSRQIGRLNTALGSLVHGIYNDVCTDFGWDVYGPYTLTGQQLLIRHFQNLQPDGLFWDSSELPIYKDVKMYTLYKGIQWKISGVGCHTIPEGGNPVDCLSQVAVVVDGKQITREEFNWYIHDAAEKAAAIYKKIRNMSQEELQHMALRQEWYQLNGLFTTVGKDWEPPDHSIRKALQPIQHIYPMDTFTETREQYIDIFGLDTFAREVLGITL